MNRSLVWMCLLSLFAVTATCDSLVAAEPVETTIVVERMCESCSKTIVGQLKKSADVADASASLETKTYTIRPAKDKKLSPRLMWETVEKAGEKPVQLNGPSGKFNKKPKS